MENLLFNSQTGGTGTGGTGTGGAGSRTGWRASGMRRLYPVSDEYIESVEILDCEC